MKNKWLVIIALFLLVSCNSEGIVNESTDSFTSLVVSAPSFVDIESQDVTKATTLTKGSLGLFLVGSDSYVALDNVQYDYVSGSPHWVASAGKSIFLNSNLATIYAYYPYDAACVSSSAIKMVSQIDAPAADLCYTKSAATPSKSNPSVSFALSHAYSKITIHIKNINYQGVGAISNISIHNDAICKEANFNLLNGQVTAPVLSTVDAPFSFNPAIGSLPIYDVNDPATVVTTNALLIPVASLTSGTVALSFTVDGVDRMTTVTMPEAKLVAGSNYVINAAIDLKAEISVDAVQCTNWISVSGLPVVRPHK